MLTQAPYEINPALRIAARLTVRGGNKSLTIEDNLAYLFRALDTLCEGYGFYPMTKPRDILDQPQVTKLNTSIKQVIKIIGVLIQELEQLEEDDFQEKKKLLQRISQQVAAAKNVRPGFGQAVCNLIRDAQLPDVEIAEAYYEEHPRDDSKKWHEVLSMYRGKVIHSNVFTIRETPTILRILYV